jgi:nitrate reductase beta subunit
MNEKNFSKEWASLSSEQQEAFRAWVKANLEAKKAQKIFIKKYISKELRESQTEEFKIDSFPEAAQKDFTNFIKDVFEDFVMFIGDKCEHCLEIEPEGGREQSNCFANCIIGLLVNWEFDRA